MPAPPAQQSLAAYLAQEPGERLDENFAVSLLEPVLDDLRTVHAQGILHRDVSPHNIYLTDDTVMLAMLDFGASWMATEEPGRPLVNIRPGYSPYEQYASTGKHGPWTDVYACAATLYRMVTGQVPPEAPDRMIDDTLQPAHALNPAVSPLLSAAPRRPAPDCAGVPAVASGLIPPATKPPEEPHRGRPPARFVSLSSLLQFAD